MGRLADGSDSLASQVIPETHWPAMRVLILVANSAQKDTSSTHGMQRSVATSPLLAHRAATIVEPRMASISAALLARDFPTFAALTMQDSNQFHATCLDTYPPLFYLNDTSRAIIQALTRVNEVEGSPVAAYTFDAGPNAVVYCLEDRMEELLTLFRQLYGKGESEDWVFDPMHLSKMGGRGEVRQKWAAAAGEVKGSIKVHQVIVSKIGAGATITGSAHSFH